MKEIQIHFKIKIILHQVKQTTTNKAPKQKAQIGYKLLSRK